MQRNLPWLFFLYFCLVKTGAEILFFVLVIVSATLNTDCVKTGCSDFDAINYDGKATSDCGCCQYSKLVFYNSSATYYDSIHKKTYQVISIKIKIGGDSGIITKVFANGPPDCDAEGTFTYQLKKGDDPSWYVRVFLSGSAYFDFDTLTGGGYRNACEKIKVL